MLDPILFLVYNNDLPDLVTSNVRLFADDMAVNLTIEGPDGGRVLQNDIDKPVCVGVKMGHGVQPLLV